ncbi:MAG: hypothetical protein AVDCRST_MAG65-368, partial [uncultured Solirubrobacteraceae bacterium]
EANRSPHCGSGTRRDRHRPGRRRRARVCDRHEGRQGAGLRVPGGHRADPSRLRRPVEVPRQPVAAQRDQPRTEALPQLRDDGKRDAQGPLPPLRDLPLLVHAASRDGRQGGGPV